MSSKLLSLIVSLIVFLPLSALPVEAQTNKRLTVGAPVSNPRRENLSANKRRAPVPAVVITEKLAVLRFEPSFAGIPIQRMRVGRNVLIVGERRAADGVIFYRVSLPPDKSGWVQAEAVASNAKIGDDERLARLIRVANGFDQLELASVFLENFPKSAFRPAILLLAGDLAEEAAQKLSSTAARKLNADEIQASGAPVHSFYLNFNELDRYRKANVNFVFNSTAKQFHYDGATWRELLQKFSAAPEAAEARKRLDSLGAQIK